MDYVNAFWVGGLICALVQILLDRTKLMPGRIMVLLVCAGAVLGFCNIYGPFQQFAKVGASVPLLGFGKKRWTKTDFWASFRAGSKPVRWESQRHWFSDILHHGFLNRR